MPIQFYHLADIPSSTTYPQPWQLQPRFNLNDVARIAGRVAAGASRVSRVATPIGIASVVAEGLVIAGLKVLESKPTPLTQEQESLANDLIDALEYSAQNVFDQALYILESTAAAGALELLPSGFGGAQDVAYTPEGVNVARAGIDGIIVTTAPRPNGIVLTLAAPSYNPYEYPDIRPIPATPFIFPPEKPPPEKAIPIIPPIEWETPWGTVDIPAQIPSYIPFFEPAAVPPATSPVYRPVTPPAVPIIQPSYVPLITPAIEIPLAMPANVPEGAPETIPMTEITVQTGPNLDVGIEVVPAIEPAVTEENTRRKDKKPRGMLYLAMLRLINRTWGTLTELDDFSNIVQGNLTFTEDTTICISDNQCILVRAGQKFSDLPARYKAQSITQIGYQGIPVSLDYENFAWDLLVEELTDTAIGLASTGERMLINKLGLRGPLDYGNVSTWWNRVNRIINTGEP